MWKESCPQCTARSHASSSNNFFPKFYDLMLGLHLFSCRGVRSEKFVRGKNSPSSRHVCIWSSAATRTLWKSLRRDEVTGCLVWDSECSRGEIWWQRVGEVAVSQLGWIQYQVKAPKAHLDISHCAVGKFHLSQTSWGAGGAGHEPSLPQPPALLWKERPSLPNVISLSYFIPRTFPSNLRLQTFILLLQRIHLITEHSFLSKLSQTGSEPPSSPDWKVTVALTLPCRRGIEAGKLVIFPRLQVEPPYPPAQAGWQHTGAEKLAWQLGQVCPRTLKVPIKG